MRSVNILGKNSRFSGRRALSFICAVIFSLSLISELGSLSPANAATAAPEKSHIRIYKGDGSKDIMPGVYILTNPNETNTTYRVYYKDKTTLIGETHIGDTGSYCCAVTLNCQTQRGVSFYVTRQKDGEAESAKTAVTCPELGSSDRAQVTLRLVEINENVKVPSEANNTTSSFEVSAIGSSTVGRETSMNANARIEAGKFYQADVRLTYFPAIDTALIPIRYDTSIFEPASCYGLTVKEAYDSHLEYYAAGRNINGGVISTNAYYVGIMPGMDFMSWKQEGAANPTFPSSGANYQYVNTTTGLIRLMAGSGSTGVQGEPSDAPFGMSGSSQMVRFYFKALKTVSVADGTLSGLPVWFASEDDCPEEYRDSLSERVKYYDTVAPNGIKLTLGGAEVMTPPPVLNSMSIDTAATVSLDTGIAALPESYYKALNSSTGLSANEVKIYNYTNSKISNDGGITYTYGLDYKKNINDRLIIERSLGISAGDTVKVYKEESTNSGYVRTQQADSEGKVDIDLSNDILSPEGGTLYVSVTKNGSESKTVAVTYPKEVTRDVWFKIYKSRNTGAEGETYNGLINGQVRQGERIQLRIYFSNFYELMMYGFVIGYDTSAVQVADREYQPVENGPIREADFKAGASPFSVGADLANVTLTEQVIYQAYESGDEEMIGQLLEQLGMSREEFDAAAEAVEVKYAVGVSDGKELPWKGGLVFTNDKNSPTDSYPYVYNNSENTTDTQGYHESRSFKRYDQCCCCC